MRRVPILSIRRRRNAPGRGALWGLLPILWLAATSAPPAGLGVDATDPSAPRPVPPSLSSSLSRWSPAAAGWTSPALAEGWLAVRDPRTGELVALAPGELDHLDAERRGSSARAAWVPVERTLPNGAVEIELPEWVASPLYGWIDERGMLRTGHTPPPATERQAAGRPEGRR
jgi:hypothetical protein